MPVMKFDGRKHQQERERIQWPEAWPWDTARSKDWTIDMIRNHFVAYVKQQKPDWKPKQPEHLKLLIAAFHDFYIANRRIRDGKPRTGTQDSASMRRLAGNQIARWMNKLFAPDPDDSEPEKHYIHALFMVPTDYDKQPEAWRIKANEYLVSKGHQPRQPEEVKQA